MTVFPTNRFKCDRCETTADTPMHSAPPSHQRSAAPEGWATLQIGTDPQRPSHHLCPKCNAAFEYFMGAKAVT